MRDLANPHQPTRFAIIPENNFLSGVMTIHQVPEEYQHINGPVGEVEILMVGESMAPMAPPNGVRFPVIGADEVIGDSGAKLCPDAGKVKWEVE